MRDGKTGRLAVQRLHRVAMFPFPLRSLPHDCLEFRVYTLDLLAKPLTLLGRQHVELVGGQHFAVLPGCQRQAHRGSDQGDALLFGLLLHVAESLFVPLLQLLIERLAADPVFVALKGCGQRRTQLLDQPLHRGGERSASARQQRQAARLLRIGKIVDVAPVGRRRRMARLGSQQILDHVVAAGTAHAKGVDVVALPPHPEREADRLGRPLLADESGRFLELAAQRKRQFCRIATAIEPLSRQWSPWCKAELMPRADGRIFRISHVSEPSSSRRHLAKSDECQARITMPMIWRGGAICVYGHGAGLGSRRAGQGTRGSART